MPNVLGSGIPNIDFDIYKIGKKHHFKLKYNRSGKLKKYNIAGFFNYCFEDYIEDLDSMLKKVNDIKSNKKTT